MRHDRDHILPKLLKDFERLTRDQARTEQELAAVRDRLLAATRRTRSTRRPRTRICPRVRALVAALHAAGSPVDRHTVAVSLGIAPTAVTYWITRAIRAGLVERVSHGLYACTASATAVLR